MCNTQSPKELHDLLKLHIQLPVLTKYYRKILSSVLRHKIQNYILFMLPDIRNSIGFF